MLSTALYRADDSEDPLTRIAGATGELPGEPVSYNLSGLCVLLYVVFIYGIIATTRDATTDRVLAKKLQHLGIFQVVVPHFGIFKVVVRHLGIFKIAVRLLGFLNLGMSDSYYISTEGKFR